jgi:phenylalanyl-tRNA synthetase beta subunit
LFSHTKKWQENYQHTAIKNFIDNAQSSRRTVSVQTDGCRAYCAIDIHSIKTAPSHFMTRVMMYDAGLQPKLNWIDFSNIFMHIAGHPIHCFDADTIQ